MHLCPCPGSTLGANSLGLVIQVLRRPPWSAGASTTQTSALASLHSQPRAALRTGQVPSCFRASAPALLSDRKLSLKCCKPLLKCHLNREAVSQSLYKWQPHPQLRTLERPYPAWFLHGTYYRLTIYTLVICPPTRILSSLIKLHNTVQSRLQTLETFLKE